MDVFCACHGQTHQFCLTECLDKTHIAYRLMSKHTERLILSYETSAMKSTVIVNQRHHVTTQNLRSQKH